jgi:antitoxin component YwqK of YwqJK toxin-antitoxin module
VLAIVGTPWDAARMSEPEALVEAVDHYPNGNLRFAGHNLDGKMHGTWTFFRADGSVMRTGAFDRGRQVGVWRTLARDGTLVKETDFGA